MLEEDKDYRVFNTQKEASTFIFDRWEVKIRKRNAVAPKEVLVGGQNPTVDYLIQRWWGISNESIYRLIPTNEGTWCVYWKN